MWEVAGGEKRKLWVAFGGVCVACSSVARLRPFVGYARGLRTGSGIRKTRSHTRACTFGFLLLSTSPPAIFFSHCCLPRVSIVMGVFGFFALRFGFTMGSVLCLYFNHVHCIFQSMSSRAERACCLPALGCSVLPLCLNVPPGGLSATRRN